MNIECPHCNGVVLIEKINCGIFRHGYNIHTKKQINPHESKVKCEEYAQDPNYVGCCKPFSVKQTGNGLIVSKCDYV